MAELSFRQEQGTDATGFEPHVGLCCFAIFLLKGNSKALNKHSLTSSANPLIPLLEHCVSWGRVKGHYSDVPVLHSLCSEGHARSCDRSWAPPESHH